MHFFSFPLRRTALSCAIVAPAVTTLLAIKISFEIILVSAVLCICIFFPVQLVLLRQKNHWISSRMPTAVTIGCLISFIILLYVARSSPYASVAGEPGAGHQTIMMIAGVVSAGVITFIAWIWWASVIISEQLIRKVKI